MREIEKTTIFDLLVHYMRRQEISRGRGELLQILGESLEEENPKIARAISAVADDMITEARATIEEVQIMAENVSHGMISNRQPLQLYGASNINGPEAGS